MNVSYIHTANTGDTARVYILDGIDWKLLLVMSLLTGIGLVMVASSSVSIAEKQYGDATFYLLRQFWYLCTGLVIAVILWRLPFSFWEKSGPFLMISGIVLLALVLVPGIGKEVNGSHRWLYLGFFNIQVTEIVKLASVIYLSGYLVRRIDAVRNSTAGFIRPLALLSLMSLLILLEPDYGAAAVLLMTAMGMLWLGGARLFQFIVLLAAMLAMLAILAIVAPYRMDRLTGFVNPWADPFNSGFQLTQALIAFGRGEWFGAGLGESVQKLFYLPEAHTDFVFAVMAEELGLVAVIFVILLYTYVVIRSLRIGRNAERNNQPFIAYLSFGIGIWFGLQVFINIGVNMGLLPTKGLTLPLMSYGGSNLVTMIVAMMLLLRADNELRKCNRKNQGVAKSW